MAILVYWRMIFPRVLGYNADWVMQDVPRPALEGK